MNYERTRKTIGAPAAFFILFVGYCHTALVLGAVIIVRRLRDRNR